MPVHNRNERAPVGGPSVVTPPARDPQRDLHDIATQANRLKHILSTLSTNNLNGYARKQHILEEINKASLPEPTSLRLPISSDVVQPSFLPRTIVGILGGTGYGKSTLLSSILGKEVSPTSDVGRGTAAPTIIVYHPEDFIEASLTFMAEDELWGFIETALELLEKDENNKVLTEEELKKDPSYALVTEAFDLTRKKLLGYKKRARGVAADGEHKEDGCVQAILDDFPDFVELLGTTITIRENDEKEFVKALEGRIGSARKKKGPKKWALLTQLVIKCNSDVLADGTILVDLPGSGDCSLTVLRATAEVRSKLDVKLVAVQPARASTEAIVINHIKEEIARRLHHAIQEHPSDTIDGEESSHASSSGLAIIMTRCDALHEADAKKLEEDEDVGPVLKNEEYQRLGHQLKEAQDALENKTKKLSLLRSQETHVVEATVRAPVAVDVMVESSTTGSKRASPYNLRSASPIKRARLSDPNSTSTASGSGASDDWDDIDLAHVTGAYRQVELEVTQLKELVARYQSQRTTLAWMARYKISGVQLRQVFHSRASEACQNVEDGEDDDMEDDREDYSLPVFATGAEDFNRSSGNDELEWQTGVPALRAFLRHLGTRAEDRAIISLLRPFRTQVKSTHALLTATDRENLGDRVARQKVVLSTKWRSADPPLAGSQDVGELPTTATATAGPSTEGQGIRDRLNSMFAESVEAKINGARASLEGLREKCANGVIAATEAAQATAQALVDVDVHWSKHRAVLNSHGVYTDFRDYNVAFSEPFIAIVEDALKEHRRRGIVFGLRKQLKEKGNDFFDVVQKSAVTSDKALQDVWNRHIDNCRTVHLKKGLLRLKKSGNELLWDKRHLSEPAFFSDAVKAYLQTRYEESAKSHKGRNSITKMKKHFVKAVGDVAAAMFRDIVQDFVKRQTDLINEVESLVMDQLKKIAQECEVEMSNAWVVPNSDKVQLDARAEAARDVNDIEQRLAALEAEIIKRMQQAENDAPTCHPPSDALRVIP